MDTKILKDQIESSLLDGKHKMEMIHLISLIEGRIEFNLEADISFKQEQWETFKEPTISCCILTYNEERCISRCLKSVEGVFDEVVVLDSMSTDKTKEIVNSHYTWVRFVEEPWKNDFSKQRNKGIDLIHSDWVFFIDADETLVSQNLPLKKILKMVSFLSNDQSICLCPIIKNSDDSIMYGTQRIFQKHSGLNYFGKVHEELRILNGDTVHFLNIKSVLEHDGYQQSIVLDKEKKERNRKLIMDMIEEEPQSPKWIYLYAREIYESLSLDKLEKLLSAMEDIVGSKNNKNNECLDERWQEKAVVLMCQICIKLGNMNRLEKVLEKHTISEECVDKEFIELNYVLNSTRLNILKLADNHKRKDSVANYSLIDESHSHIISMLVIGLYQMGEIESAFEKLSKLKGVYRSNCLKYIEGQVNRSIKQLQNQY